MAPRKKKSKGILPVSFPNDVVEHIFSFLPIKEAVHNGVVSARFKDSWRLSRILDFGPEFGNNYGPIGALRIIDKVFDRHIGSQIQSFMLDIDPLQIKVSVEKWIRISVEKGVEELHLDFMKGRKYMIPPFDLSTIETLKILKLRLCVFRTPQTLKGLKFLETLVLKHTEVTTQTMRSVFGNCVHLKTLELIECSSLEGLMVKGRTLTKFQSLTVARCRSLFYVLMDAPSLKEFRYSGSVCCFKFVDVHSLKDVILDYGESTDLMLPLLVKDVAFELCHMRVLSATSVFLEGMTKRVVEGEFQEVHCEFSNLEELQIFIEPSSYCNLFDIANFLKNCPSLQRFYLDITNFEFECGMYWEAHQKLLVEKIPSYKLDSLKYVEIRGFKGYGHELDIARFFLRKSTWLETLVLVTPKNAKTRMYNYDSISDLRKLSTNATIRVFQDFYYFSPIPPKHVKKRVLIP